MIYIVVDCPIVFKT